MNKVAACCLISTALVCSLAATAEANNRSSAKADWQLAEETEVWTPEPPVVSFNERNIPSDAQVLFDGKSLDQWESAKGGDAKWNIRNGVLVVAPKMGDIRTRDSFCDVQLHIEWMAPTTLLTTPVK